MSLIVTPDSDQGKELARWNTPRNQVTADGQRGMGAIGYEPFPRMVYKAAELPNGRVVCGNDEWDIPGAPGQPPQTIKLRTSLIVADEREYGAALANGYHPDPQSALKGFEARANDAARLAYDNRRMSEAAKAELREADAALGLEHALDVPRKPGRPKKAPVVSTE